MMLTKDCLNTTYLHLTETLSVLEAFENMKAAGVSVAPIIDTEGKLVGMITEQELRNHLEGTLLSELLSPLKPVSIFWQSTIIDGLHIINSTNFDILPVTDNDGRYMGILTKQDLLAETAQTFNYETLGTVFIVLAEARHFSLADLMKVIEQEQVKVLAIGTTDVSDESGLKRIMIKINQEDPGKVESAIRRHGYIIEMVSNQKMMQDITDKAEEFLHFLSI